MKDVIHHHCRTSFKMGHQPDEKLYCSGTNYTQKAKSGVIDAESHRRITQAKDVSSLVTPALSNLSVPVITLFLQKLAELNSVNEFKIQVGRYLTNDPYFVEIKKVLHSKAIHMETVDLLRNLESLLALVESEDFIIESLETQVTFVMKNMPMRHLLKVLTMYELKEKNSRQKKLNADAISWLDKRWLDISNPKDIVSFMYFAQRQFNGNSTGSDIYEKLELRALDLIERMSSLDLYRVLYQQAKSGRRNASLKRSIVYHLNNNTLPLSDVQIMNLLYSCCRLSIYDETLLDKISEKLLYTDISTSKVRTSIIVSLGLLKWRHVELLELLGKQISMPEGTANEIAAMIVTCGAVNYMPSAVDDNLGSLLNRVEHIRHEQPKLWLDVVWSLCVLEKANAITASTVLDKEFHALLQEHDVVKLMTIQSKLKDVNNCAMGELTDYEGPYLKDNNNINNSHSQSKARPSNLALFVLSDLRHIVPSEKYFNWNTSSSRGYHIDIELIVDSEGRPLKLEDHESSIQGDQDQAMQEGQNVFRLAVKVLDFSDMTLKVVVPNGLNALSIRQLTNEGYTMVEVPFFEYSKLTTTLSRVQYLQGKIHAAVSS
ncbi:unnamed protein product [Owenia fusiformis]|uniref:RAP domain-containing protein n=1 Tax=Owenia fusiformis TaxID=6347 RepID=A0A8S4N4F9_OWEFU|nr:unnamed protein product [Owenia fusiformis]